MLNLRKSYFIVSHFKNCVAYSKRARKPKSNIFTKPKNRENYSYLYGHNPGVDKQVEAMQLTEKDFRDPNILEDLESQFWNADKIMDDVERAEHINKELLGIFQVKRKQFKDEKYPNMLLWDEKQEIKYLHAQDPEEWTVMRLAFSYPATPSVIKKVLKAKWKLRTQEDIEKHDTKVRENWKAFEKGTLEIPSENLKKHLKTFSSRTKLIPNLSNTKEVALPSQQQLNPMKDILKDGGVFGNIYKSYKQTQTQTEDIKKKESSSIQESSIEKGLQVLNHPVSDQFIIPQSVQKVQLRTRDALPLDEMRKRVMQDSSLTNLSYDEEKFIQEFSKQQHAENNYDLPQDPIGTHKEIIGRSEANTNIQKEQSDDPLPKSVKIQLDSDMCNVAEIDLSHKDENDAMKNAHKFVNLSKLSEVHKKQNKEILASFKTAKLARTEIDNQTLTAALKDYVSQSSDSYPLQIVIPKDLWKKGALYRVKDRFYTDDGEFLYRVPGLVRD